MIFTASLIIRTFANHSASQLALSVQPIRAPQIGLAAEFSAPPQPPPTASPGPLPLIGGLSGRPGGVGRQPVPGHGPRRDKPGHGITVAKPVDVTGPGDVIIVRQRFRLAPYPSRSNYSGIPGWSFRRDRDRKDTPLRRVC